MPDEKFRIRIGKDGKIHLYSQELGEERLRLLRELLEDCLGPVESITREDFDGSPPGVRITDETSQDKARRKK
jgi:hypothetical protein